MTDGASEAMMMTRECRLHPTVDHFGPGTEILKCAHLGDRFVVMYKGRLGKAMIDYVEINDNAVIVEAWRPGPDDRAFDELETKMLAGIAPDPEI